MIEYDPEEARKMLVSKTVAILEVYDVISCVVKQHFYNKESLKSSSVIHEMSWDLINLFLKEEDEDQ